MSELREMVRYTAQQWGAAQARSYAHLIDVAATALVLAILHQRMDLMARLQRRLA